MKLPFLKITIFLIGAAIASSPLISCKKESLPVFKETALENFNEGINQLARKRSDIAILYFQKAIEQKPDYTEAYNNLGVVYDKSERWDDAVKTFQQAIDIKPEFAEPYFNLGIVYAKMERYIDSAEAFEQAIRLAPGYTKAYYRLCIVYTIMGEHKLARQQYDILKDLNPQMADLLWQEITK